MRRSMLVLAVPALVAGIGCSSDSTDSGKTDSGKVSYKSCDEVKAAGKAPLHKGEPGYSSKLDRDGDGVACS